MLIYKSGDILKSNCNIICHQVNENGVMGGGLALQIATQYPEVEKDYTNFCDIHYRQQKELFGQWQLSTLKKDKYIANCFTQQSFNTRYDLLEKVFREIRLFATKNEYSIAVPYKYGCGIANGNWEKVENIFKEIFIDYDLYIYKLDKE